MTTCNTRLDALYKSEVITLPNIKIVSNENVQGENIILYENGETSPFHRKDDTVLTFLVDGKINSFYEGLPDQFQVRSRSCTFVYGPCDNEHHILPHDTIDSMAIGFNKRFFYNLLQEDDRWMEGIVNKIEKNQPFSFSRDAYRLTPEMFAILNKIRTARSLPSLRTLHLQNFVNELFLLQLQEITASEEPAYATGIRENDRKKLQGMKAYLDTNFLEELSLAELVKIAGLNTYKIKTGFKSLYGKSVFEYIRWKRMEYAHSLLANGLYNITEVSSIIGYEHVQHFSTAFKKHFGTSPGKYKY
ncbi:helix-turn-helix domain-containing protein [Flavobacterium selenitireducens]|uniref:helix-turn-helix domain-containing protein n=1 Tax=Flavobacterium selenitireducens TaxID=2722704 RepID=UPI00168A6086|nr:AraC family transcriptional regulator [Flavobacterium selenitireducens]MBD3581302.1 helix-turn-helix transcriptional regulator [Flavobacterium selenitireducens]